ncbi:MAG: CHASE domain-containing protein [Gammaproteobacteria bacterium]|nr:CHASE domain-containing protein [Gammaproteobacteria bacterium]
MEKGSQLHYLLLPSTLVRTFLWLLAVATVLMVFASQVINGQKVTFDSNAKEAIGYVHEQLIINDAALSGFGSLLTSVGPSSLQQTRDFTKRMRDAYPHIYMFEALVSVDPSLKHEHEAAMQEAGYTDYKITRYVSKKNPTKQPYNMIKGVPMHFPIFFIDPYLDSVKGLMGFDMMSARNMRDTLLASLASGSPTASQPYQLREGGKGYVLIKALDTLAESGPKYSDGGLAVLLLIKTDALLADVAGIVPAANIRLLYGEDRKLAAQQIFPKASQLPLVAIDSLMVERKFDDLGQPFTLSITGTAGFYARHIQVMGVLIIVMLVAYWFYYRSLFAKYGLQLQRDAAVIELSQQHAKLELMVDKRTQQLQRKSDENTRLAQQLIRVQEDQYHHIARELHDEFGQTLTAIKINAHILENAQTVEGIGTYAQDITNQADALYATMHDMIERLRPEALDMFGLKVAVEECILGFHLEQQNIDLDIHIDDAVNDVEEIYSIASYRIVQELVNNAVKYAKLSKLRVVLEVVDHHMNICVEDDGIGFDPIENQLGFGLSGLDERARSLGGTVDINTVIGEGVQVCVRIPLQTQ